MHRFNDIWPRGRVSGLIKSCPVSGSSSVSGIHMFETLSSSVGVSMSLLIRDIGFTAALDGLISHLQ